MREEGREEGREGGSQGGREREGVREEGREGEREGRREEGRKRGGEIIIQVSQVIYMYNNYYSSIIIVTSYNYTCALYI